MPDAVTCLCNHPEPLHLLTGRCSVLGCTCTLFEWDPIGLPDRHSQHTAFVPECLACEDAMAEAREMLDELREP